MKHCDRCGQNKSSPAFRKDDQATDGLQSTCRNCARRAMIRDTIDLPTLAIRDNWTCHLCGEKVTRKTWSRDYVVPLDKGGSHTWNNIALAHRRCASKSRQGHTLARFIRRHTIARP